MNICLIPARGGSKRIPKKNIVEFCGLPLIAHSITNAIKSKVFDEVIVSSDSDEILNVGLKFGAKAIKRSSNLSDDFATTTDVMADFATNVNAGDTLCCLYATAPLINEQILKDTYAKFTSQNPAFLFGACEFSYPIQRAFDANCDMFYPQFFNSRSQDLTKAYHDAGVFYFALAKTWMAKEQIFTNKSSFYELKRELVCDIDTLDDLEFARLLYGINHAKNTF